ncbi:ATP-dependent exoDNAse (exonuclease V) beta subunit (contains helicase and exonuclease domains) [Thermus arciformis]|uniref:DNA 3'-5' helicase n=1 Tax=Thermus arciformis TaxID=482827 RepID=A0A1G7HYH7_9DEIN|nr:UvrD-helicase domain-containing protein [Thermus arciformis]SDF05306.1 ATP-dependent exoDNAse (exonuclease V) beta subunit (contains helicase and exonuclease domains) [Thermus arciformis]
MEANLYVAGAGTGKTYTLAERYLRFLEEGLSPLQVVAVTFTERAALELRHRVRQMVGERSLDQKERVLAELEAAPIGTLHALAARICREFPEEAGVPADFQVMEDLEAALLLEAWLEEVLLEELQDPSYASLVEAVGYEGLLDTLRKVAQDPLAAQELLEKGLGEVARALRLEAWRSLRHQMEKLFRGENPEERFPEFPEGWRTEEPQVVPTLLDWAGKVKFNKKPWLEYKDDPVLKRLRELLEGVREGFSPGVADERLEEVWPRLQRLAKGALARLEERRFRARRLGYADLEVHALRALEEGEVKAYYQGRFRRLLVDEFQDTNPVQVRLLKALFPDLRAWTVVGDLNQSIYSFRRADPKVMEKFQEEATKEGLRVQRLEKSHRYHQGLADFHNRLFPHLLPGYGPVNAERRPDGEGPWVFHFQEDLEAQARFIAQEVGRLLSEGFQVYDLGEKAYRPMRLRDVAVLGRTWRELARVAEALRRLEVPAVEAGGGNLLETRAFKDAYLALRFLGDPKDEEALVGLLRSPFFALTDGEIRRLAEARTEGETLWEVLEREEALSAEAERARKTLRDLLRRKALEAPSRLLQRLDGATGYTGVAACLPQGRRRVKDWEGTLDLVRKLEVGSEDPFLVARHLRLLLRNGLPVERPPLEAGEAVTLLTVHGAKGLEWPVVFVLNVGGWNGSSFRKRTEPLFRPGLALVPPVLDEEGNPSALFHLAKRRVEEEEKQEENRLLYVAATRASERLYLLLSPKGDLDPQVLVGAGSLEKGLEATEPERPWSREEGEVEVLEERIQGLPLEALPVSLLPLAARDPEAARRRLLGEPEAEGGEAWEPDGPQETEEEVPGGAGVGQMTHALLERFEALEDLEREGRAFLEKAFPGAEEEGMEEAMRLARTFFTAEVFAPYRGNAVAKEVPVVLELLGVRLEGRADRVGKDWVLDYKTDRRVDAEAYLLQVGVYALALGKPRALVADLREGNLRERASQELKEEAEEVLRRLMGGEERGRQPHPTTSGGGWKGG